MHTTATYTTTPYVTLIATTTTMATGILTTPRTNGSSICLSTQFTEAQTLLLARGEYMAAMEEVCLRLPPKLAMRLRADSNGMTLPLLIYLLKSLANAY